MLYFALILSVSLLIVSNIMLRCVKHPAQAAVACGIAFLLLGGGCLMAMLLPVLAQTAILCMLMLAVPPHRAGPKAYPVASVAATLLVYALAFAYALRESREYDTLRARNPIESLEERLPPAPPRAEALSPDAAKALDAFEQAVEKRAHTGRASELRRLHEDSTRLFVNSPGFGIGRMGTRLGEQTVGLPEKPLVPQPGGGAVPRSIDVKETPAPAKKPRTLLGLHEGSVVDFAFPQGFGYVKDRRQVAGFRPHGFGKSPDRVEWWSVTSVELVGLLRGEPVVYVTENLPNMKEVRRAPTRPLDTFEADGLGALQKGEDHYIRGTPGGLRMLGAIRSTKQCIQCHGGERGDLLGAFSYALRSAHE